MGRRIYFGVILQLGYFLHNEVYVGEILSVCSEVVEREYAVVGSNVYESACREIVVVARGGHLFGLRKQRQRRTVELYAYGRCACCLRVAGQGIRNFIRARLEQYARAARGNRIADLFGEVNGNYCVFRDIRCCRIGKICDILYGGVCCRSGQSAYRVVCECITTVGTAVPAAAVIRSAPRRVTMIVEVCAVV